MDVFAQGESGVRRGFFHQAFRTPSVQSGGGGRWSRQEECSAGGNQEGACIGPAQQVLKVFVGFSPVWSSTLFRAGLVAQQGQD